MKFLAAILAFLWILPTASARAAEPAVADSLREILLEWRAGVFDEVRGEGGEPVKVRLGREEEEMLQALGYVR